jgi:3-phosphoshikimate 1-carboxyvinyltransferase
LPGLHTLKIKETDRLEALRIELTKLGANISDKRGLVSTNAKYINPITSL